MKCVYTKSKDFKKLAEHYNVSINQLEQIVHKYWIETNKEDWFPTDIYVNSQIGKIPYYEKISEAKEIWDKEYSSPKEFISIDEYEKAKNQALKFFPAEAVVSYKNSEGNFTLAVRQPVGSINEIVSIITKNKSIEAQTQDEIKLIKNKIVSELEKNSNFAQAKQLKKLFESKLSNSIIKENKKEVTNEVQMFVATPSSFTFKDGTTVNTPFKLNGQQEEALNALDEFIKSSDNVITLSGYAGTGKTSLMEILAQKYRNKLKFTASTNKAAAVLQKKVNKAGFQATTLHKAFGIAVELNTKVSEYDAKNLVNKIKDENNIRYGDIVVIDEASMISENHYDIINQIAKEMGAKIIYLGDEAQLPPVNEDNISKVFHSPNGKVLRLTQVERTGDNAILKEATALRNDEPLSGVSEFNSKGEGVAYVKPDNKTEIANIVKHFVKGLESNPEYFRILAYTNKAVSAYNTATRKALGYEGNIPKVGEPMVGYANWGYSRNKQEPYRFVNSESYKVTRVGKPEKVYIFADGKNYTLTAVPVTLKNSLGKEDTFNYIDVIGNQENRTTAFELSKLKADLFRRAKTNRNLYSEIRKVEEGLFVNGDIVENGRTLQAKVIDFGYAMTVHKSQGSTFNNVLVDDIDIAKASQSSSLSPVNMVDEQGYDMSKAEQVGESKALDLGLLDSDFVTTQPTKQETPVSNNNLSLVQQLRYVAISRATDTVTIISNNVKKEGSPLDTSKNQVEAKKQEELPEKESNRKETVKELIGELKNQLPKAGKKLFFRADIEKFLKEQGLNSVQEIIGGFVNPKSLPKGEFSKLESTLLTKYGNKSAFGDIIQTENYEYTINYKGAGEFDIIEYHQIDNGTINDDYNDREGKEFSESPDRWSSRNGFTEGEYNSNSYNVTEGEADGDYAGLDLQTLQGESQQAKSNVSSKEYQGRSTRLIKTGADGTNFPRVIEAEGISLFITQEGEVYGFVDKDGNIYLDETVISPEHPIHEYTHLWDRMVAEVNPELWKIGMSLFKQIPLWQEIENNPSYGQKWKSDNINVEKLEFLIASEVHSRLTGERGQEILDRLAKEKGTKGIVGKLKEWLYSFWVNLKSGFGTWSSNELADLERKASENIDEVLKELSDMVLKDFAEGNMKSLEEMLDIHKNEMNNQNNSTQESENTKVSLPGYEYFTESYEDTTIDSEWKIRPLKAMDLEFSAENTQEKNESIIKKMQELLNFKGSKKEWYEKESSIPMATTENSVILTGYDVLLKQVDNLLDGQTKAKNVKMTSSEVRHTAETVANAASDLITEIQSQEGFAEQNFPEIKTEKKFSEMTRKEIVDTIGINNILGKVKENISLKDANGKLNPKHIGKVKLLKDNWAALVLLGADTFALNEGFGYAMDYSKLQLETVEHTTVDEDTYNTDNDVAKLEDEGKDEQEHWQVESRSVDTLMSLSEMVRQALHECYIINKDGSIKLSEFGIKERIDQRRAVNSILRWVKDAKTLSEMVSKLSKKQNVNPWLSQLITRLSDISGNEAVFQSQFYNVFRKSYQYYSIVKNRNGEYYSMIINDRNAMKSAKNSIIANLNMGLIPVIGQDGKVNTKYLGTENSTGTSTLYSVYKSFKSLRENFEKREMGVMQDIPFTQEAVEQITDLTVKASALIGYPINEVLLEGIINHDFLRAIESNLGIIVRELSKVAEIQRKDSSYKYEPFGFFKEHNINSATENFLMPIVDNLEDTMLNSFFDSGKMYQSFTTPSYLTTLISTIKTMDSEDFENWMMDNYGHSEWYKFKKIWDAKTDAEVDVTNAKDKGWRTDFFENLLQFRDEIEHKVELNFDGKNYMRDMNSPEYLLSLITEYYAESGFLSQKNKVKLSWFRVPMISNKPSSEFIKMRRYDESQNYKSQIVDELYKIALQEIDRIATVTARGKVEGSPDFIESFDKRGKTFCFLPVLNDYLNGNGKILANSEVGREADDAVLAKLLKRQTEYTQESKLSKEEKLQMEKLLKEALMISTQEMANTTLDSWENAGITKAAENIQGVKGNNVLEALENFIWNDFLAAKNILQLTIGDIAFYKNAEDLQKRLAQIHAPGIRANTEVRYKGQKVSDGMYRTIILRDFDKFKSDLIENITEVFERKIQNAPAGEKAQWEALKESLVGENGAYRDINVTDAQGFCSPSSYRKKALMFGKWSEDAERVYNLIKKKKPVDYSTLKTVFQPLKPFVYGTLKKATGVSADVAPITSMNVPFQAKNSEYLLVMADAILKGEETSRPNMLGVIFDVMETSYENDATKGIDTVQFESTIKSGLHGAIDIHQFMEAGEKAAFDYIMGNIYTDYSPLSKTGTTYNTDIFVQETSYDNFCIQQEVPAHFIEHSQAHGSQERMIIPSDLDYYYDSKRKDVDAEDNIVLYEFDDFDSNGKKVHRKLNAKEFRREYEETIAASIAESIQTLRNELHLDGSSTLEKNLAISKILQREILSSPRYGVDLMLACSIDKKTGNFRIPLGDPIQCKRIEQLLNSIIKNRINKQKVAGGPIVQVTNYGTSKKLNIRFKDKKGGLLMTRQEWEGLEKNNSDLKNPKNFYKDYKDYVKGEQAGIAYFECYAPIWSQDLVEKFGKPDGTIDIEAMEKVDPDLLKLISYRIPTEDKYSIAPMKIVGFLPREAGEALMLPYELTAIDGSDFDVDKRYVMRKQIFINKGKNEKTGKEYLYTSHPKKGKYYRDNKVIDMSWSVLTHETTADKILNPGGFDPQKKMGYMVAAYKSPNNTKSWEELEKLSIKELKNIAVPEKDLTQIDVQVQFYEQNAVAGSLIGIFAVNKIAHATLESNGIFLDIEAILGEGTDFTAAGKRFYNEQELDPRYDSKGNLIGKTLGCMVAASVDAVKDPVLNLMNINKSTAGILNALIRMGMPFEDAALFLSNNVISKVLKEYANRTITENVTLDNVIEEYINKIKEEYEIDDSSNINTQELTKEELIEGLRKENKVIEYKVLTAFQKINTLTAIIRKPTFATRFNSMSAAVGPLVIDNLILNKKMNDFRDLGGEDGTGLFQKEGSIRIPYDIDDAFADHPILDKFSKGVNIASELFTMMPAGSGRFEEIINNLGDYLTATIMGNRDLLSSLSDFYSSYLFIQSGLINSTKEDIINILDNFPREFNEKNYKEKYPDNAFIQAIETDYNRETGKPFLKINITGLDNTVKEEYGSAWSDLHKDNPELSKKLFEYCFFRGGIGFTPKSFMSLLPLYVKENLYVEKDGNKISYVDTLSKSFGTFIPEIIIDQWVRNNSNNNKLVPFRDFKAEKGQPSPVSKDLQKGTMLVLDAEKYKVLDKPYIKTAEINSEGKKVVVLWKQVSAERASGIEENQALFEKIDAYGNNGDFFEAYLTDSAKSVFDGNVKMEDKSENQVTPSEESYENQKLHEPDLSTDKVLELSEVFFNMRRKNGYPLSREEVSEKLLTIRNNFLKSPSSMAAFLVNLFKEAGIELTKEEAINEFKKYC